MTKPVDPSGESVIKPLDPLTQAIEEMRFEDAVLLMVGLGHKYGKPKTYQPQSLEIGIND